MVVSIANLMRLGQLYPAGSLDDPIYAFSGGSAVQCWLHRCEYKREYHDIDIFTFKSCFPKSILSIDLSQTPFFIGGFMQGGIVGYSPTVPIQLQICRGGYFDSEINPFVADVRQVTIHNTSILALSPEFIAVSKLSYPNVHRSCDFLDVLALRQYGYLQSYEYLSTLLAQTSLGKLIDTQDILNLKTENSLQMLVDAIHQQLIKRFLYWDRVNVDALNSSQFFVLLDMGDELFDLPINVLQFIDTMLETTTLNGRNLQIAKLGLHFLMIGIPSQSLDVLKSPSFQALVQRGLALISKRPNFWLSGPKSVFMILHQLTLLEYLAGGHFDTIWSPDTLVRIMQRVLFHDLSRFVLITSIKSIYHDLKVGQISELDCTNLLHDLLVMPDWYPLKLNVTSDCAKL